jgi:hypothetical protein
MTEYSRVPDQFDYTAAVELQTEVMDQQGGSWVYAMKRDERARTGHETREKHFKTILTAQIFEPENQFEEDEYDEVTDSFRPKFRATHAYKHGLLSGFDTVYLAHDKLIEYKGILSLLMIALDQNTTAETSEHDKREILRELGERGFDRAGERAKAGVERWAEGYTSNIDHQRLYTLGAGATFYAGYFIHENYIDSIMKSETESLDWAEFFSASDTGE